MHKTLVQCFLRPNGVDTMKESSVSEWHKWLRKDHENVEDDNRSSKISQN
jgi:hypothetical protein